MDMDLPYGKKIIIIHAFLCIVLIHSFLHQVLITVFCNLVFINFASSFANDAVILYLKDNVRFVISVPYGVIHWIGRKANISDVHAGLILQRHSPFVFHFDNLALINPMDTKAIQNILALIIDPQVSP